MLKSNYGCKIIQTPIHENKILKYYVVSKEIKEVDRINLTNVRNIEELETDYPKEYYKHLLIERKIIKEEEREEVEIWREYIKDGNNYFYKLEL